MPKINFYFFHHKRVEEFVAAIASLTAFYFLLEANNLSDYMCNVGGIDVLRTQYETMRCTSIAFPSLLVDLNCSLTADTTDTNRYTLQRLASECGYPPVGGDQNSNSHLLVSVLLGVNLVCLILLLYFTGDEETDQEKNIRRENELHARRKPGCCGCVSSGYQFGWLRSIRIFACLLSWGFQLGTRIWDVEMTKKALCHTTAYTTQTGLLYLWPLALLGTLLSHYPPGTICPVPVKFGSKESSVAVKLSPDDETEELKSKHSDSA